MNKYLKWVATATVLAGMGASLMTGCGSSSDKHTATAAPAASATAEAKKSGPDTSKEVKLYGYLLGAAPAGFQDVMGELNSRMKKDINATMEINYIGWADLNAKYPLVLAAGENLDWIYTAAWCQMPQQAAKGAFKEVTRDMYETYMPKHWAKIKDTTALKEVAVNGKTYMIPTSTPDKKSGVVLYREDLRKKYGVPEIKKFGDMEPYLEAIKKNESGMVPLNLESTYDIGCVRGTLLTENYDMVVDVLASTGGGSGIVYKPFDKDGKLYIPSSDPEMLPAYTKAAQTTKDWYDKGYINKNAFANKVRSKESLVQGKSAVAFGNSIDTQSNIAQATAAGMEIGIIPVLSGKNGKTPANAYTNNGIAIAANSKNWERTLMAMDLIMENEAYDNLVYYGIKDKHYVLKDGKVAAPAGVDDKNNPYPVDAAGFWFVNKDLFKPLDTWTPGYIKLQNDLGGMLATDTLAAFTVNGDGFKTEQANCNQAIVQYDTPISFGAVKNVDDAFKTLDKNLKAAGIDKIKADLEKQIKDYLASQK